MSDDTVQVSGGFSTLPRRWKWALVTSLAANLAIAGAFAGAWIHGPPHGHGRGFRDVDDFGLAGYARRLPPERRAAIRDAMKGARAVVFSLRGDVVKARLEAAEILAAEPFDPSKLKAALEAVGVQQAKLRAAGQDFFLDAAGKLTADERSQLAEWWKKRGPGTGRFKKTDDEAPEEPSEKKPDDKVPMEQP